MNAAFKVSQVKTEVPSPSGLKGVVTVSPHTTWEYAITLMEELGIRHLVVMTGAKFLGLLSSRDIPTQLVRRKGIQAMLHLPVSEIMRNDIPVIDGDTEVGEALVLMLRHRTSALPMIKDSRVTALITESDLLRLMSQFFPKEPPEEISNPMVSAAMQGEAMAASPMVQKIMKALSDAGI